MIAGGRTSVTLILSLRNEPWFDNQDRPGFVAQLAASAAAGGAGKAAWRWQREDGVLALAGPAGTSYARPR